MYEEILSKVVDAGIMRNLTPNTIETYSANLVRFFNFTGRILTRLI